MFYTKNDHHNRLNTSSKQINTDFLTENIDYGMFSINILRNSNEKNKGIKFSVECHSKVKSRTT